MLIEIVRGFTVRSEDVRCISVAATVSELHKLDGNWRVELWVDNEVSSVVASTFDTWKAALVFHDRTTRRVNLANQGIHLGLDDGC